MAVTKNPWLSNFFEAERVLIASCSTKGTMLLSAIGKFVNRVKSRAFSRGFFTKLGSVSMISSAAILAAITAGGKPVEYINVRALVRIKSITGLEAHR